MGPQRQNDPTLPPPWQALFDPASGAVYYWNPVTNTTQYERPTGAPANQHSMTVQPPSFGVSSQAQAPAGFAGKENGFPSVDGAHGGRSFHNGPYNNGASAAPPRSVGSSQAESYRQQHSLSVLGEGVPDPYTSFDSVGFPEDIMEEIRRAGFSAPTPIQAQAWPIAVQGRDLVAIAKTGSGKTCGFLLPALLHIKAKRNDPRFGPTVLVLAPTRELACQIKDEADKFAKASGIKNTCVYGGAPKGPQLRDLQFGVDIVIATPGRLNDFREGGQIRLSQVSYLVLDEADRMLDMGFEPQIQKIVRALPPRRQTLFFSATWPKEVKAIAAQFVGNKTAYIFVGGVEEKLVANMSITQYVEVLQKGQFMDKLQLLTQILRSKPPGSRIIIFCTTKRTVDQLARSISRDFRAAAIHGDKKQQERDYVIQSFKDGRMPVMVATDVAARGLDVPNVAAVVNFDFPTGIEDYIHRIGRTGRAGAKGESYTFLTFDDAKYAKDLVKVLSDAKQAIPPPLQELAMRSRPGMNKQNRWQRGPPAYNNSFAAPSHAFGGGADFRAGFSRPAVREADKHDSFRSSRRSRSRSPVRRAASPRRDSHRRYSPKRRSRSPVRSHRRSPDYGRYSPR